MANPEYKTVFNVDANTDPVPRNKGALIVGDSSAGSVIVGFYSNDGLTGAVAAGSDGVAGVTATVRIAANATTVLNIKIANIGAITNCEIKGVN
tara:strand:- start:112 stop:393 length:282 start_codon:yes stop_codon:yes gene_type:complete